MFIFRQISTNANRILALTAFVSKMPLPATCATVPEPDSRELTAKSVSVNS